MDAAVIALIGSLAATAVSAGLALRENGEARRQATLNNALQRDLARLNSDLETERHERIALLDRRLNAEEVLARYREPLAAAAFDLQSRCYNIVKLDFFTKFGPGHERSAEALTTTLFRFAQYFGWTELLRREIQFLSFPEAEDTRTVTALQASVRGRLATSSHAEPLMIWADEQRALGERMIVDEHDKVVCMGYARFCDEYDARFEPLCRRMRQEVLDPASAPRLREAQHLLCELVEALDEHAVRYTPDGLGRC